MVLIAEVVFGPCELPAVDAVEAESQSRFVGECALFPHGYRTVVSGRHPVENFQYMRALAELGLLIESQILDKLGAAEQNPSF